MRMYTKLACLLIALGLSITGHAQTLTPTDSVFFTTTINANGEVGGSDVWGYTAPSGDEYAIMGTYFGVAFVRAADGMLIEEEAGPLTGDSYFHKDIKTYGHYAYVVAEMFGQNAGLSIFDLQYLPDSVRFVQAYTDSLQVASHNLSIDTATGYAYIEAQGDSGIHIYSLADPENPVREGFIPVSKAHDMYARSDTVWVAEGFANAFSVWDVSDKQNPVTLTRITDPGFGYAHNIWPSPNGKYFYTTEETEFKTVKCWEFRNALNVTRRGQYIAPCSLAHNAHAEGNYVWISHYECGVRVIDWQDPDFPVEVAGYDTYQAGDSSRFLGCWGIYPHAQSGVVYSSNFDGKLMIYDWMGAVSTVAATTRQPEIRFGPNPAADKCIFYAESDGQWTQLSITDATGKRIVEVENPFRNGAFEWQPNTNQPAGIYFAHFSGPAGNQILRLIRQ